MPRRANPFRYDNCIDFELCVRSRELRKLGVFDATSPNHVFTYKVGYVVIQFRYDSNKEVLFTHYRWKREICESWWFIRKKAQTFGNRYYFACPQTARSVDRLYLENRALKTRHELDLPYVSADPTYLQHEGRAFSLGQRLLGLDGKGPPRGSNKAQIVAELEKLALIVALGPDVQAAVRAYRTRMVKMTAAADVKPDIHSTRAAAARMRREGYVSPAIIAASLSEPADQSRLTGVQAADGGILDRPIDFVDRYGVLSVRELTTLWPREAGGVWAEAFRWENPGSPRTYILADRVRSDRWFLLVRMYWDEEKRTTQVIEIEAGGQANPKRYLRCPVTGRRVDQLYLRGGRFACAEAQRLVHRSQRVKKSHKSWKNIR